MPWLGYRVRFRKGQGAMRVAAAQVWPLASQINYQHVPIHLRVLFANVVAFFWCAPGHRPRAPPHSRALRRRASASTACLLHACEFPMAHARRSVRLCCCRSTFLNLRSRTALASTNRA